MGRSDTRRRHCRPARTAPRHGSRPSRSRRTPCDRPTARLGVGTIVAEGLVLTAAHVVEDELRDVEVDGQPAQVVVLDVRIDAAVLEVEAPIDRGAAMVADVTVADAVRILTPSGVIGTTVRRIVTLPSTTRRTGSCIAVKHWCSRAWCPPERAARRSLMATDASSGMVTISHTGRDVTYATRTGELQGLIEAAPISGARLRNTVVPCRSETLRVGSLPNGRTASVPTASSDVSPARHAGHLQETTHAHQDHPPLGRRCRTRPHRRGVHERDDDEADDTEASAPVTGGDQPVETEAPDGTTASTTAATEAPDETTPGEEVQTRRVDARHGDRQRRGSLWRRATTCPASPRSTPAGEHVGFDADFCRVIAAAVLGDADGGRVRRRRDRRPVHRAAVRRDRRARPQHHMDRQP